jgi:NAD(P)-dependent dehydrogenase (short-subunit alcohol dehydrogenase family)
MDKFLSGKGAVVTGGTRGIGRAIAEALAAHGAGVAICGTQAGSTAKAVEEIRSSTGGEVVGQACDVRDRTQVKALFAMAASKLGGVEIAVNNAGIGIFSPVKSTAIDDWHRTIDTNLTGVFHCSQEALFQFGNRGGGYLFQIGSLAGKNPFAGGAAYNASKFALNGFSEALMLDHRHDNVRVTTICPGSVDTGFSPRGGEPKSDWKIAPEDIADVIVSLLRIPARTMVSYVEMRPSRPRK